MNTIYRLTTLFALTVSAIAADVKFSSLPTATSPSTNSYLPIIDLNLLPAAQNQKYLLTNLANATPAGITNALGISTTPTELQYVSGVTSAIQTQLNAKANATFESSLTHAGSVVADFSSIYTYSMMATGNVTIASTGLQTNRTWRVLITAPATNITVTLPSWNVLGTALTNILAGKSAMISAEAWGTADTNVWYAAAAQP